MKKTLLTLAISFSLLLTGCHSSVLNDSRPDDLKTSDTDYPVKELQYDWSYYNTSDELTAAATDIYSGTVTDISFEIQLKPIGSTVENPFFRHFLNPPQIFFCI